MDSSGSIPLMLVLEPELSRSLPNLNFLVNEEVFRGRAGLSAGAGGGRECVKCSGVDSSFGGDPAAGFCFGLAARKCLGMDVRRVS